MKTSLLFLLFPAFLFSTKKENPSVVKYNVDTKLSKIKWTGHAEVGTYAPSGTISIKSGLVSSKDEKITSGNLIIDMSTITHENKELEGHLKNEDFFDIKKFPTANFQLQSIAGNKVLGKLTIKGITKPIIFLIETNLENGKLKLVANLKIDRTKFNIKYNSTSFFQDLGNFAIKNDFDLEIIVYANAIKN